MTYSLSPRISTIEANAKIGNALATQQGLANIVSVSEIEASTANGLPINSSVKKMDGTNRRIYDFANDLGARFGIERIPCQQFFEIQDEVGVGANGGTYNGTIDQRIVGVSGDKYNQIRLVGYGWYQVDDSNGNRLQTITANDYAEIIFYGTALNVLLLPSADGRDVRATIDNGVEGSNIYYGSTTSTLLNSRNYAPNQSYVVASNLTLGWHVIKLRFVTTAFCLLGFDVITEGSTLNIRPGTAYGNSIVNTLSAVQSIAYNSSFESGSNGGKGGCVAVYLKNDGTIGKAITPTDTTALFGSSANHANEEVVRTFNTREFGAGRNPTGVLDDFSLVSLSAAMANYAFTLDDGTTTLTASQMHVRNDFGPEMWYTGTNGGYLQITFVGTGIDVYGGCDGGPGGTDTFNYSVDGGTSTTFLSGGTIGLRLYKFASGLAYGTHTLLISRSSVASSYNFCIVSYKVYAPKLPSIPSGAILLSQYYLNADYAIGSAGVFTVATGILRKHCTREFNYVGSSWLSNGMGTGQIGGWQFYCAAASNYMEYNFFGTGFEARGVGSTTWSANNTVSLQSLSTGGSLQNLTVGNFPTASIATYGGWSYASPPTLSVAASNVNGSGLKVSGLPLGLYKLRITNNTTSALAIDAIDIITPVHFPKGMNDTDGVIQNSLLIGSCALGDKRILPTTTKQGRAWAQAVGVNTAPTTTSTSMVPLPDMSVTIKTTGNPVDISFWGTFAAASIYIECSIYIDGVARMGNPVVYPTTSQDLCMNIVGIAPLGAGVHKIDVYWGVSGGTGTAVGTRRWLRVMEL